MDKKLLDILEPYEEECLFSWIIRMANYHGIYCFSEEQRKNYKKILFGTDVGEYPYLYFEPFLPSLVKNISLPDSIYFANAFVLLKRMTVYPFYASFLNDERKKESMERFTTGIGKLRTMPGLYVPNIKKSKLRIKYCTECVKKHGLYLIREHQIPENEVCFEHQVWLKTIPYQRNWGALNFVANISDLCKETGFEGIKVEEKNTKFQLALLIHQVFQEGLKEDISIVKGKIRKKLKELGYLGYKNYSMEFNEFYKDLKLEEYFASKEKAMDFILKNCFDKQIAKVPSPVDFLFIIYKLFGSLDALYRYEIRAEELQESKYSRILQKVLELKMKTGINYIPTVSYALQHKREAHQVRNYCIEGRIEGAVQIGKYWFVPKDSKYPEDERFGLHKDSDSEVEIKGHYLTVKEYGAKYNGSVSSVCSFCRQGRIENAIKVNGRWFIPEDAPYPVNKT